MSRVGDKIKDSRMKAGLSQKALAKKLGVAEKFINEVETGRRIINESVIQRLSKILNTDINDVSMVVTDEDLAKEKAEEKAQKLKKPLKLEETNEVWNQAFGSVLKNVPIYDYSLGKVHGSRQLAVVSNKIEGHAVNKVFYIIIENDDMIGFRIAENDIAFCHVINEIENNSICLIEHNQRRIIRQVKRLDNAKALLISNKGSVLTETVNLKDIKPLAKIDKLEIKF